MQIDVIASLLSGRLVRERIGPAMLSAVQSQVSIFVSRDETCGNLDVNSHLADCSLYLIISALEYQMGAVETNFEEVQNIFDTGGCKGLTGDSVEKIPKITITNDNIIDASGERVSCSVCLQVCFVAVSALCEYISVSEEKIIHFGNYIDIENLCIFRTFSLVRQLEVCLIAITCSTYHA